MAGRSFFDKVWDAHVIADLGEGFVLLHIDRHLLHDLSGARAMHEIERAGHRIAEPALAFACPDHAVSSAPGRTAHTFEPGGRLIEGMRHFAARHGVKLFDLGDPGHGILHVIAPEMGITLPGLTLICGDSHTCTHGGLGALAFGVGASELVHGLATQTLVQRKPKRLRLSFEGRIAAGVTPKDMILHAIARFGAAAGSGHAVEYAGDAIRSMPIEGRLTICNLSIEMGAKIGMIAPDDTTFDYIAGRDYAPRGRDFEAALAHWRTLAGDADAVFDQERSIDCAAIAPQISWGTSPEHTIAVDGCIPDPASAADAAQRRAWQAALEYQGLTPGAPIAGTPIDWVFIGSCTNARLSDLRQAAAVARRGRVAAGVTAWVVPGSERVKREAEAEGLDALFRGAGFEWREPGCSMCVASNGEIVPPRARSVSTSNRNFVGRQGPQARTHLASPAMAAAAALHGAIADVRTLL